MTGYPIVVMVGSLRVGSYNRALAEAVAKLNAPGFTFSRAEIGSLPLYSQPETTCGTVTADVLAEKDPNFHRPDMGSRIRHSRWTTGMLQ